MGDDDGEELDGLPERRATTRRHRHDLLDRHDGDGNAGAAVMR